MQEHLYKCIVFLFLNYLKKQMSFNHLYLIEPGLRHLREIKITINRRNAGFFMSNFIYFYVVRSCILSLYVI